MIRYVLALLVTIAFSAAACGESGSEGGGGQATSSGGGGGGGSSPYACSGACACDDATASCVCQGGSTCAATCAKPCSLGCQGTGKCDLTCGEGCELDCSDAGCTAHVGAGAAVTCGEHGVCEIFCEGDCTLDCPGSALCMIHCVKGASCAITSCDAPGACPEEVSTCRTACPPTTG